MTTLSRATGLRAILCLSVVASIATAQVSIDSKKNTDDALTKYAAEQQELHELMILDSYQSVLGSADDLPRQTDRVIYGNDDRRDVYELLPGETDLQFYHQAAAVVLDDTGVIDNGNGTYDLVTSNWTSTNSCGALCTSEPYYGQLDLGWCSAFLVGPDILVTAGHCVDSGDCGSVAFVFGFDQLGPTTDPLTTVPADNVYFCDSIIDQVYAGSNDHSVIRLDRPVVGRTPLPIRRTGTIANGDPLVMIGHPQGIPKKIEDGGVCKDNNGTTPWFYANVDAYAGNSGSMVINMNTGEIEGILVRGNTDFTTSGGCCVSNQCADTGCPDWEEISKTTSFASFVPELGLSVTPAATTIHDGPTGGPFTNPSTTYTLNNPTANPISYEASLAAGGTDFLLINGGTTMLSGSIPANSSVDVTASIDASANALAQGIYSKDILFEDLTNALSSTRTHTLEVNQTGISVTPAGDYLSGGPFGGPFDNTTTYTVTSTKSTPVNVSVSSSETWINLDGSIFSQNFTLTGTGDSRDITVAFNSNANALANGLHTSTLTFSNTSGGAGSTTRDITLDVGRYTYASSDTPIAIPDNATPGIESTINVTDNFCVGDVDVAVDITHTYQGDIHATLIAPDGTAVTLHAGSGGTVDNVVATYDDDGVGIPAEGPGALADFEHIGSAGTWTLAVYDDATNDTGTLNSWTLKIASAGAQCAPVANDVALGVQENAQTAVQLDGFHPSGLTIEYIITTLPANGTLYDPNAGEIVTAPYTIELADSIVEYKNNPGFTGPDTFTYVTDDSSQQSGSATVTVDVGGPVCIITEPFDTDPLWTTEGQWAFGAPQGVAEDPSTAHTGANVYGYNLAGDYTSNMAETNLTSTPFDLTGFTNVSVAFCRDLAVESATYDHATFQVSNDNSNWTNVWDHTETSALNDADWITVDYDISAIADNQATVYLRWVMGTTDGSVTYGGWNIDDIKFSASLPPLTPCEGDANGDNVVDVNDISYVLFRLGNTGVPGTVDGDANGDGITDVNDISYVLFRLGPC